MLFNRWKRVVRKLLGRYFEEVLLLGRTPLPAFELPVLDGPSSPVFIYALVDDLAAGLLVRCGNHGSPQRRPKDGLHNHR